MTTITATWLQSAFNDDSIEAEDAEIVIDDAIDLLNSFGADLDNLTGTAGSKTGSYTSGQAGAIKVISKEIYARHYKNASGESGVSLGPASVSYMSDTGLLKMVETLSQKIKGGSNIAFVVGDDTSGLT